MGIKCLDCGLTNDDQSDHCIQCGTSLQGARESGVRRSTVLEEVGGAKAAPVAAAAAPEAKAAQPVQAMGGGGGRRKTQLDEGPTAAPAAQKPAYQPAPAAPGGRKKTQLDEGPLAGPADQPGPRAGHGRAARAVGWMVSFDFNPAGQDHVIREGRNTIGSDRDNDISLFYDPKASSQHAWILYKKGECAVIDKGSVNGTIVNGEDIGIGATQHIQHQDTLTFGASTFKLFLLDPDEVSRVWPDLAPKKDDGA